MSGNKKRPSIVWDSSVFIAWFNQEQDKDLDRLRAAVEEVDDKRIILNISSVTRVEVLDTSKSPNARELFSLFCKRSNMRELLQDQRISELASDIRQDSLNLHANDKRKGKLKTPDSIIAATAIIYSIPLLFSYDPDLLNYSESDVLRKLKVEMPTSITRQYSKPLFEEGDIQN